jgi:hypothetical protein
MKIKII